ncbi:cupredoxin family copper-binding protein [Candidatus Saccharibacteria bacterium]|nr:cupredoxin family copper-binding protein [Candidatus Saccharibacteria bacterium]
MKKNNLAIIITVLAILVIGGGAIFATTRNDESEATTKMSDMGDSSMTVASDMPAMSEAEETDAVEIKSFSFGPQAITVKAGTKVTWTNQDSVKHNAAKDDGQTDGPDGPLLAQGESYSYTFDKPGTYTYHCDPHRSMKGVVYVTE